VTFNQGAAFTADVCGGGFCALMLRAMPPGTPVEGTIVVRGRVLPYAGRVVWARPGDVRLGVQGRNGVAFTQVESNLPVLLDEGTTSSSSEA
jgi:hypothetical protein